MKLIKKGIFLILIIVLLVSSAVFAYGETAQHGITTTPSGIPFEELQNQLDAVILPHLGTVAPGVAVVVVSEGEIVFSHGWGYANIAEGIPVDPSTTVFEFASISKLFIWVSAMQLVEQGLLDLDADIANYLPLDFVNRMNWQYPITMRNLMNHTAGFEASPFHSGERDATTITQAGDLRDGLMKMNPRQIFEPGAVSAYSNFGTSLAVYVISHITGQSYAELERNNVFLPSGMMNTLNQPDWVGNHAFLHDKALGYSLNFMVVSSRLSVGRCQWYSRRFGTFCNGADTSFSAVGLTVRLYRNIGADVYPKHIKP